VCMRDASCMVLCWGGAWVRERESRYLGVQVGELLLLEREGERERERERESVGVQAGCGMRVRVWCTE
jgi:hypothetical protein